VRVSIPGRVEVEQKYIWVKFGVPFEQEVYR
jgi:hypothetical protein